MTESARRLEATHGIGKMHLWPFCGLWACTWRITGVGPTPAAARDVMHAEHRDAREAQQRRAAAASGAVTP